MYPFGHGFSYTNFRYDSLRLESAEIGADDSVGVTFNVTNTGDRSGDEVVQLYVNDVFSSVARPEKELRHFKRIHLEPGETAALEFTLTPRDLRVLGRDLKWIVEPGTFRVLIGTSSSNIVLTGEFEVK